MKSFILLLPFFTVSSLSIASAQDKYYVWTYPYQTTEANEFELESNSCFLTPSLSSNNHTLVQQFELEYGVTDRFQLGFYQVFSRDYPSGELSAESFMVEALYKLAAKDRWIVDPMIYLEYERGWNFKTPNHGEAKLILSRDFGRLNGTINGIAEFEFGGRSDFAPEFSAGASYEIVKGLRAGVETFMTLSDADEAADEDLSGTGIGPTISVATPWFDIASGVTFGVSRNSNAVNFRINIDFEL
jgi:hypothetical protein